MTAADASRFQFALSGTRQGVCCFGGVLPSLAGPLFVKAENFSLRPGALSLLNKDRSCPGFYTINILLRKAVPLFFQSFLRTSVRSTYIVWQMPANRRATSIPFYGNFNSRTIPAYRTFPSIYVTPQVSGHSLPWSISPVFFLPWVSPSSDTHPEQNLWLFQNMYLCSS